MNHLRDSTTYVVVEFDEKQKNDTPVIDLVPRSWLTFEGSKIFCAYPTGVSNKKILKWIADNKFPNEDWMKYPVTNILSEAKNHEQGTRRLQRTLHTLEPTESTDAENEIGTNPIFFVTEDQLNFSLSEQHIFPEIIDSTLITNICENDGNGSSAQLVDHSDLNNANKTDSFDVKLDKVCRELSQQIESSKRSILYDINKKMNEIKNMMAHTILIQQMNDGESSSAALNVELPTATVETFLQLEQSIRDEPEQKEIFKKIIVSSIGGSDSVKQALNRVMPQIMTKSVQLQFSGCGRKSKSYASKRPFMTTSTFNVIRELLQKRFGNEADLKIIVSQVSRWLSGAGDREGGRVIRATQAA